MKVLALLLVLVASGASAFAEEAVELAPFDRLGKNNVIMKARQMSGGSTSDYKWQSGYGSFDRDKTASNTVEVEVSAVGSNGKPLVVEFFFVAKELGSGGGEHFIQKKEDVPAGNGKLAFTAEATHNDERLVYAGARNRSGQRLVGWFGRAVRDGAIIGVVGSSDKYVQYAAKPEKRFVAEK
jgi:hypothetical protein